MSDLTADAFDWHNLGGMSLEQAPDPYEWFYFDLQDASGLYASFSFLAPNPFPNPGCPKCDPATNPLGISRDHVCIAIHVRAPNGTRYPLQAYEHGGAVRFNRNPWSLEMLGCSVRVDPNLLPPRYGITLNVPAFDATGTRWQVTGTLQFDLRLAGWMLPNAEIYRDHSGDRWHRWAILAPHALVQGEVALTDGAGTTGSFQVNAADGYHDHNWGPDHLSRPFSRWLWARAFTEQQPSGDKAVAVHVKLEASGAPAEAYVLRDLLFARGGQIAVEAQDPHVEVAEPVPGLPQPASGVSGIAQAPLFTAGTAVSSIGYLTSFVLGDELVAFPTYLRRAMQFALHSTDPSLVRSGAGIAEVMEPAKLYASRGTSAPS